jgi:hypothetical protein
LHRITKGKPLDPVPWEAWPDLVLTSQHSRRAAQVDAALVEGGADGGLTGIRAALHDGHDRALASALVAAGWRAPGADERGALLRNAVASELVCAAIAAGWSWQFSWSRPTLLVAPDGETVDVMALGAGAVQGDWTPVDAAGLATTLAEPATRTAPDPARSIDAARAASAHDAVPSTHAPFAAKPPQAPTMPSPPCPPFEPGTDHWRWNARLPGSLGKKVLIAIGDDEISFGSTVMRYDDIAQVSIGLRPDGATFLLTTTDGSQVKQAPSGATDKTKREIARTTQYLWDLLSQTIGPRRCREIEQRVRDGERVVVAGLVVSSQGIAESPSAKSVYPWHGVGDLRARNLQFQLPVSEYKVLIVKQGAADAILLARLIPQLRALYS